jgi:hypothetical protein
MTGGSAQGVKCLLGGERRGDRLRGRVARLRALRAAAHAVALQRDLTALQDQEPGRAAAGHVNLRGERIVTLLTARYGCILRIRNPLPCGSCFGPPFRSPYSI